MSDRKLDEPKLQMHVVIDFGFHRCEMEQAPQVDLEWLYDKAVRDELTGRMRLTVCPACLDKVREFGDSLFDREAINIAFPRKDHNVGES